MCAFCTPPDQLLNRICLTSWSVSVVSPWWIQSIAHKLWEGPFPEIGAIERRKLKRVITQIAGCAGGISPSDTLPDRQKTVGSGQPGKELKQAFLYICNTFVKFQNYSMFQLQFLQLFWCQITFRPFIDHIQISYQIYSIEASLLK